MSQADAANGFWFLNGHATIHLPRTDSPAGLSVIEHRLPGGFAPPFHVHRDEDEIFYLLEGEFRFKQGDQISVAGPGEVVHLPRGIPHGFKVLSPSGRMLTVSTGGFEAMLRSASTPAPSVCLPEQVEPTPEMQARLARLCAENGIDLLGPPID